MARRPQPGEPHRKALRVPPGRGLRRRASLPSLLGLVRAGGYILGRGSETGHPAGADAERPADARNDRGTQGRRSRQSRRAERDRRPPRRDHPEAGGRGVHHPGRGPVRDGGRHRRRDRCGAGGRSSQRRPPGPLQSDPAGARLPRVPRPPEPARFDGQVQHRVPRDPGIRDGGGVRRGKQALRIRRHPEPRHPRDAQERDRARGGPGPAGARLQGPHGPPDRLPVVVRHGSHAGHLTFDDPLRGRPLFACKEGRAGPFAPHPHPVPGGLSARRDLRRPRGGDSAGAAGQGPGRPLPHQHGRGIRIGPQAPDVAEEGHAPDHHDHRRQAERDHPRRRQDLQELGRP